METNQLTFEHICFKYKGNDNQLFTDLDVTCLLYTSDAADE